jgi:autotransporter-associated beta strand protein
MLTAAGGALYQTAGTTLTINGPVGSTGPGTLTKAGAGTLVLNGANSYAGDTSVQQGLLRLNSPTLADAADVILGAAGMLELNFSAATPDVVDALIIGGVPMQAGLWGADGSGAQFTSPLITGTGLLEVEADADFNNDGSVDAADITAWQGAFGLAPGSGIDPNLLHSIGDSDFDSDVDGVDFLAWQQQLGLTPPPVAAIPEPATAALAAAVVALVIHTRRLLAA